MVWLLICNEQAIIRIFNCVFLFELLLIKILREHLEKISFLSWIGGLSYELFLTEGIFFWNEILYELVGFNYIGLLLYFVMICVLSILIQKVSMKVNLIMSERMLKYDRRM